MKKLLLIAALLTVSWANAQAIEVSTTSHTGPQLVNNVLINSPCVSATNITWSTGSNFGSSNGIGFFQNTNPGFPMASGVVLSTGSAQSAAGPNTTFLNEGSTTWPGDGDLEATLAQAGISMSSTNATVLEFDFTPISSHFNFDFIFASEEYGNFQCQFSDAFAFLLTNELTGQTTNLALVPNTNTPISVVTIRDFLYNSSCPSANSQYFGSFNGGSDAEGSATNFNGQTVLLNASSNLIPNTPYHIKLVIADRSDFESDSSIFISSDSFNIGQDVLGLDMVVSQDTALCVGETYTLTTGLSSSEYSFSWTKNGTTISAANGPSITVTEAGNYGVTYTNLTGNCIPVTDTINIEYFTEVSTPNPKNLYRCDTGSSSYTFDLSINTAFISAGFASPPIITYHGTAAEAENGASPLSISHASTGGETVYVRIQNSQGSCYTVKSFQLLITPAAAAFQPADMVKCARGFTIQNAFFNLSSQSASILNGQSSTINKVTFYTTAANAAAGTNPITNPNNFNSAGQIIYVRVQNATDPTCFSTTSFVLTVNLLPEVDELEDVIVCESFILPELVNGNYFTQANGMGEAMFAGDMIGETQTIFIFNQPGGPPNCAAGSRFKVTVIDPLTLSPDSGSYCESYTLPTLEYGEFRTEPAGGGEIIPAGTSVTESKTVYVYYETLTEPFCVIDTNFDVTILPSPQIGTFESVFDCTSYTLPALSVGKYYTEANGGGSEIPAGTEITASQTVYVYAASTSEPVCESVASFSVVIGIDPPQDVHQCQPYTLPEVAVAKYYTGPGGTGQEIPGGTVISQSTTVYLYIPQTEADCTIDFPINLTISQPVVDTLQDVTICGSYVLPVLTNGNYHTAPGGAGTILNAGDVISASQKVYIYAEVVAGCSNETSFQININPMPAIDSRSDIDVCNDYLLTQLDHGNYYTGPNGTGTMLPAGSVITESQTVYIYAPSEDGTGCNSQNSFELFIFSVEADSPANVSVCDSYILPPLTVGNYYQNPGGPENNLQMLNAGDVITSTTTLYIYTESGERINCSDENSFTITINVTPVVAPIADVNVCDSYTLPALAVGNYFTGPNGSGTLLNAGDVLTTSQKVYVYAQTSTTPNCDDEEFFQVNIYNADELADVVTCGAYILPELTYGKYYTGSMATGVQLYPGAAVIVTKTIYIYAASPFAPACFDETSFSVLIINPPVAHAVPTTLTSTCDEDGTNDGITSFDLTQLSSTILGLSQTGSEFSLTYHADETDANSGNNPITSTSASSVFVRVVNSLAPNCYTLRNINITVHKLPEPTPSAGVVCFDSETQALLNSYTISSGLTAAGHTFQWKNELGEVIGNGSTYEVLTPGVYSVIVQNNATGCISEEVSVTVSPSEPAIVAYTVDQDFADTQNITVIATGIGGNYEYQLDNGDFQSSPIFYNVSSGIHTITVNDINGCDVTTVEALVVNYPHFFTPNGDGINDTWNIFDLKEHPTAKVSIFDRYGKFIREIKTNGAGWDGNHNGSQLPSTDYWFVVEYTVDDQTREFRAHFAMKR